MQRSKFDNQVLKSTRKIHKEAHTQLTKGVKQLAVSFGLSATFRRCAGTRERREACQDKVFLIKQYHYILLYRVGFKRKEEK